VCEKNNQPLFNSTHIWSIYTLFIIHYSGLVNIAIFCFISTIYGKRLQAVENHPKSFVTNTKIHLT
jgi:hypothetical protein